MTPSEYASSIKAMAEGAFEGKNNKKRAKPVFIFLVQ